MKLAPSQIRKYTHSTNTSKVHNFHKSSVWSIKKTVYERIINWKVSKIGTDGLQADIICAEEKAKSTF